MDSRRQQSDSGAELPDKADRLEAVWVSPPHPSLFDSETLLGQCDLRFQRRSGPGGQHRNKTSSGVFLHHESTGVVAEATERRSQAVNRQAALLRLRLKMAIELRTASPLDALGENSQPSPGCSLEQSLRDRYRGHPLKLRENNPDRPAVMALLLNDLHAAGGQPSLVGPLWSSSTSAVVNFIKTYPAAFAYLNAIRAHHGRSPLR